jgi:hypothetical protein
MPGPVALTGTTALPERLGVAEDQQANPHIRDPYEAIREICEGQGFFDEIEFAPFGEGDSALVVIGSTELPALGGEVALTLWRGNKDGRATTGEEVDPMWLRFEGGTDSGDSFEQLSVFDPEDEGFGLTLPDFLLTPHFLNSCRALLDLLVAAEPTDHGLSGEAREQNLAELDDAVQDGFDAADSLDIDEDQEVESDLLLHSYCENSSFVTIAFGLKGAGIFTTRAVLPTVAGDVPLALWVDDDESSTEMVFMLDLKGKVQPLPEDFMNAELDAPWGQGIPLTQVKMGLQVLKTIHLIALEMFNEYPQGEDQICAALTMLATNALREGDPLPLEVYLSGAAEVVDEGPEWHEAMDEFTEQCKLGFMVGVVVEESLHGNLNIRATTIDPVTRDLVPLQVFWKEPGDGAEPEHWLSVGSSTHPAHGADDTRSELLAGFPQESKEYISHTIDHLHEMIHLATDVVNGKTQEVAEAVDRAKSPVQDVVSGHMQAEAIEDALAGLNGVARLYTGYTDRDVRNS